MSQICKESVTNQCKKDKKNKNLGDTKSQHSVKKTETWKFK